MISREVKERGNQSVIVRRDMIEARQSAEMIVAQARELLDQAKSQAELIKETAFQEGFEQGISEANIEIGALIMQLKNDCFNHQQALSDEVPMIVGEICSHLVRMDIEEQPGFDIFMQYLKSLTYQALSNYTSQTNLLLRVGGQFAAQIRDYLIEKMSSQWVEQNLDVKPDPNLTHFAFSIEHDRGVLHFDGKEQLLELLAHAFFDGKSAEDQVPYDTDSAVDEINDDRILGESAMTDYLSDNDELGG